MTPTEEMVAAFKAAWELADLEGRSGHRVFEGLVAALALFNRDPAPDDVESIQDSVMVALAAAGFDLSGTDHSNANEIEVGTDTAKFRLVITQL